MSNTAIKLAATVLVAGLYALWVAWGFSRGSLPSDYGFATAAVVGWVAAWGNGFLWGSGS